MDMLLGLTIGIFIGWLVRRVHFSTSSPKTVAAMVAVPPAYLEQAEAERRVRRMRREMLQASRALYSANFSFSKMDGSFCASSRIA